MSKLRKFVLPFLLGLCVFAVSCDLHTASTDTTTFEEKVASKYIVVDVLQRSTGWSSVPNPGEFTSVKIDDVDYDTIGYFSADGTTLTTTGYGNGNGATEVCTLVKTSGTSTAYYEGRTLGTVVVTVSDVGTVTRLYSSIFFDIISDVTTYVHQEGAALATGDTTEYDEHMSLYNNYITALAAYANAKTDDEDDYAGEAAVLVDNYNEYATAIGKTTTTSHSVAASAGLPAPDKADYDDSEEVTWVISDYSIAFYVATSD